MTNTKRGISWDNYIKPEAINRLLGIKEAIPLSIDEMRRHLRVTFYEANPASQTVREFITKLQASFESMDIEVIPYEQAIGKDNKIKPWIAVFASGLGDDPDDMVVNKVSSLYKNPIIGIYEGKSPANDDDSNQEKLDKVVTVLAYDVVHLAVFVNSVDWTICTMNGAIITNLLEDDLSSTISNCLIPKLTAQVVPPNVITNIKFREGMFNPSNGDYDKIVEDFGLAAKMLKDDGMIMSHTRVSSLKYKNRLHERIVRAYLDHRTGMSYGFMAWQLPLDAPPAKKVDDNISEDDAARDGYVLVDFMGDKFLVEIPDIWVLSTRSGSDKANLNIATDIVRMGLVKGEIIFDLPEGIDKSMDVKPSYDTLAILAHGVGNSIISSIIKSLYSECKFSDNLKETGASLFHWHGYLTGDQLPENHHIHGEDNPSVSCSTKQSAVYSLLGKFEALEACMQTTHDFRGDIHIEPHHGTNISSIMKLSEVVKFLHSLD